MGSSWGIIPELLGFTNFESFDLYGGHSQYGEIKEQNALYMIQPVDEVWIVTTDSDITRKSLDNVNEWNNRAKLSITIRTFIAHGINDMADASECRQVGDLIYRAVLTAHNATCGGRVYLSLTGGRKTMSADMQQAATIIGCDALLHVVDTGRMSNDQRKMCAQPETLSCSLPTELADFFMPIVTMGRIEQSYILLIDSGIDLSNYLLDTLQTQVSPNSLFYDQIHLRLKQANSLLFNYRSDLMTDSNITNFRLLYSLPPKIINKLKNEFIASDLLLKDRDLQWLRKLPKTELHCHFGGIFNVEEMIEVAQVVVQSESAQSCFSGSLKLQKFVTSLTCAIGDYNLDAICQLITNAKSVRTMFSEVQEPYSVAFTLAQFKGHEKLLYEYIYGVVCPNADSWCGKAIEYYEQLGDFQGSGLFQCEAAIRAGCRILIRQCAVENIKYLELRCSPVNYSRGELTAKQVVEIIMDELAQDTICFYRIIFIASRHGLMSNVYHHIELAEHMLESNLEFNNWFAGFDLAGAESAKSPETFRQAFLPLMKNCLNLTIHAGEGVDVNSIWEAVYHLNADRVGHGLTLHHNPELLQRLRDRKIAIELCPSSNYQIVGFKDYLNDNDDHLYPEYPLRQYLNAGLHTTINTDDPGISLTNLTREYYKAGAMTRGGVSKWDIIQLVRNGFKSMFVPYVKRRELLIEAEKNICELIMDEYDER